MSNGPQQLDLFMISLPPCGRNLGRCEAVIEHGPEGPALHCITCHCAAPYRASARSPARQSNDALSAVLDGFMQGQMNFFEFLHQQESTRDDPGTGD